MTVVTLDEAKGRLAELFAEAARGEDVSIADGGTVVRLVREAAPIAEDERKARAVAAGRELRALREDLRRRHGTIPTEEMIAMKHEGHRY
jgi:antitoxin (DNA-binding transcriptional repressor) of toxin-antitoxin stability system